MTENDISQVIGQRVQSMAGVPPIVWGNKDLANVSRPYLRFEMNPGESASTPISGGKVQAGFAQVMVVANLDEYETETNTIAANIAALFPYELSLPCADGKVTITKHTIPMRGFRDGSDWLKPVQIDYVAV